MARLALKIQKDAPRDRSVPEGWVIPSSYTTALDTVSICIFLGDADHAPHVIADIS